VTAVRAPRRRPPRPAPPEAAGPFAPIAEAFVGKRGVTPSRMFGSPVLKVNGKVFAMLVKECLVVKLPEPRVEKLLSSGAAVRFDPGHGRLMRGWASVAGARRASWLSLAEEAWAFVAKAGS